MTNEYDDKYLRRLASVYVDIYDRDGFESAKEWFQRHLNDDLRGLIKPHIAREVYHRRKS